MAAVYDSYSKSYSVQLVGTFIGTGGSLLVSKTRLLKLKIDNNRKHKDSDLVKLSGIYYYHILTASIHDHDPHVCLF